MKGDCRVGTPRAHPSQPPRDEASPTCAAAPEHTGGQVLGSMWNREQEPTTCSVLGGRQKAVGPGHAFGYSTPISQGLSSLAQTPLPPGAWASWPGTHRTALA